ncbi:MAG: hypothetical protein LBE38_01395 [Deltaproteobacteria bacterium]|jgi:hypothetical protein|nr:hypothetical protein [Deltaproteobacteria bacterium]
MKAFQQKALLTLVLALVMALTMSSLISCGTNRAQNSTYPNKFRLCSGKSFSSVSRVDKNAIGTAAPGVCTQSLDPFDISAWVEAPITSFRERGLATLVLGCANLVPDAADCQYTGMPGHAATMNLNFNFAQYPVQARVQSALLAFYVENNANFFSQNAQVRGRYNIGDQFQSLGANRRTSLKNRAGTQEGWVLVDITDFAARAINEQRQSTSFEISLPCGRTEQELTTVRLTKTKPVVVVRYK